MASNSAIDCKFGTAKVGDEIILPSPFKFGEVIGILKTATSNDKCSHHTYDLYFYGAWIGRGQAKLENGKVTWRALE